MKKNDVDRYTAFRHLHESGCFVIPNPWDIGSARLLARLGFPAIATTSAGFAWTLGRPDNGVSLDQVLAHFRSLAASVDVPVNADFEAGLAADPAGVERNVRLAVATGIAGLSIEDATGDAANPLYEFEVSVERTRAARRAIDAGSAPVLLVGRSEGFIVGRPDLRETIRRLVAYAEAGADCLYAPGIRSLGDIGVVVKAVSPKPVNVLAGGFATVAELADAGVRRISVGSGLARVALTAFLEAANEMVRDGRFTRLADALPYADVNRMFGPGS